jgi:hypothetical protein
MLPRLRSKYVGDAGVLGGSEERCSLFLAGENFQLSFVGKWNHYSIHSANRSIWALQ